MNCFARWMVLALALVCPAAWTLAQTFPSGPINIVVPLAPGDAADTSARAMGEEISRLLNTPVNVVNRPGGGGTIGANSVVQAAKNGQTILFAQNSALTFRPVLDPASVPYDALRDLVPLGISSRTPSVLAVRSDAPYKTFAELIEYARKRPGQVRIGHPGPGSVGDFCVQLIASLTGAEFVAVPYTGAGPSIVALRGEHIEGVVSALGALSPHLKAGTLRGLVSSNRVAEFCQPADAARARLPGRAVRHLVQLSRTGRHSRGCAQGAGRGDRADRERPCHHGKAGAAQHRAELCRTGTGLGRDPRRGEARRRDRPEDGTGEVRKPPRRSLPTPYGSSAAAAARASGTTS